MLYAVVHATDVEEPSSARDFVDADFANAKTELKELVERDPDAYADSMADYRRRCRLAIIDPPALVQGHYCKSSHGNPICSFRKA